MATATEKEVKKVKRDFLICLLLIVGAAGLLSGCGKDSGEQTGIKNYSEESQESRTEEEGAVREENGKESRDESAVRVTPTSEITELATGLSMVRYEGEYGFDTFLEQGGTASDGDVAASITSLLAEEILTRTLEERGAMTETEVRDAVDSVSKDNFGEYERIPQGGMQDYPDITAVNYSKRHNKFLMSFTIRTL